MNLPADSCDIFKHNMLGLYKDRPNVSFKNGKYGIVHKMSYAEFLAHYYLDIKCNKCNDDDGHK